MMSRLPAVLLNFVLFDGSLYIILFFVSMPLVNLFIHKTRRVSDSFLVAFVVSNQPFFPCERDVTIEIHSSNLKQSHYLE